MRSSALLVLAVAVMAAATTSAHEPSTTTAASVGADRQLLERVYEDAHLSEAIPNPRASTWVAWRVSRFVGNLLETVRFDFDGDSAIGSGLAVIAVVLGVIALIAGMVGLAMLVASALGKRRSWSSGDLSGEEARAPSARDRSPAWWTDALDRALAAGDARAALEALWWWLAGRLAGTDAEPSWTCRDLLRHTGRFDLRGLLQRLERLAYRPDTGTMAEVVELSVELRSRVHEAPA